MGRVNLLIQNWFYKKSKGRQCKGRNSDFFQLILNAHWTIFLLSHYSLRSVLLLSYHSLTLLFQTSSLCQRWASILEQSCYCLSTLFLLSCNNLMSVLEVSHYCLITALLCSSTLPHSLLTILLQSHVCFRSVLLLSYHSLTLLFHTSLCQSWAIILKQSY